MGVENKRDATPPHLNTKTNTMKLTSYCNLQSIFQVAIDVLRISRKVRQDLISSIPTGGKGRKRNCLKQKKTVLYLQDCQRHQINS